MSTLPKRADKRVNVLEVLAILPHAESPMLCDRTRLALARAGRVKNTSVLAPISDGDRLVPVERGQDISHATPDVEYGCFH
jgi:hypothetical protein